MALISCAVTEQLICVFVFAYAKSRFSHEAKLFRFAYVHFKKDDDAKKMVTELQGGLYFGNIIDVKLEYRDDEIEKTASKSGAYEPCHEKSCLRDLRPDPTQTRLYCYRRLFEA